VIRIKATGFPQFLAAHAVLRGAGVATVSGGGNEMRVPDDTDRGVLRSVAATGALVYADLTEPAPTEETSTATLLERSQEPPGDPVPDDGPESAGPDSDEQSREESPDDPAPDAELGPADAGGDAPPVVVPDTKPQVDPPPETQAPEPQPQVRTPRKTTTRRKPKE
jgi:hypothetical protein